LVADGDPDLAVRALLRATRGLVRQGRRRHGWLRVRLERQRQVAGARAGGVRHPLLEAETKWAPVPKTLGVERIRFHDQTSAALAALVSHPIADGWSAFVEATALPGLNHAAGQSYLGTALVWTPIPRLQLDLSADFGLDDDSADVIAAFGLSWFF
jgi:hypothetical protein